MIDKIKQYNMKMTACTEEDVKGHALYSNHYKINSNGSFVRKKNEI